MKTGNLRNLTCSQYIEAEAEEKGDGDKVTAVADLCRDDSQGLWRCIL